MLTIVISSFKGGVGKTTLSILLGNVFAAAGKKVLIGDLDHQMNSTQYHRRTLPNPKHNDIWEALFHNDIYAGILPSHVVNTDIIPGSFKILGYRDEPPERFARLLLQASEEYDVCIVDCPPSLDNLVVGAWSVADFILTPVHYDSFNLEGIRYLRECIRNETEDGLDHWEVVVNAYKKPRKNEHRSLKMELNDVFSQKIDNLIPFRIPETALVRSAIDGGKWITPTKAKQEIYDAIVGLAGYINGQTIKPIKDGF